MESNAKLSNPVKIVLITVQTKGYTVNNKFSIEGGSLLPRRTATTTFDDKTLALK